MKHTPAHRAAAGRSTHLVAITLVASAAAAGALASVGSARAATTAAAAVTSLNVRSGGTWGSDLVTIKGVNFTGSSKVSYVLFGRKKADGFDVLNSTTIQANSPEVKNKRAVVDVRVVLRNGVTSAVSKADHFTYVVPTMNTKLNGNWSTNKSIAVANKMKPKAKRLNAAAVARNPGHWTPAMGRSALRRAAGWIGLPYSWAGGTYTGPSYGSRYGDGLIGSFSGKIWGFDCSGLTLYSWAKYKHLAHSAATQKKQAGRFHPTIGELQPGDLLFFSGGGKTISHVVMYAGNGLIIQASQSGWPVRYSSLAHVMAGHPRYFGATRPTSRGKQGSSPSLTSVSSATSTLTGGSTITLHGSHLDTTSRVSFGSASTYSFSIKSANTITVRVPAHKSGAVNVEVSNAWGTSAATGRARMTYVAVPTLTSAAPTSGQTTGGTTVTLTGKSFVTGTKVYFGSTASRSVTVLSSSVLSVVTPASVAGRSTVTVTTPYGSTKRTVFTFMTPPAPSPSSGS